MKKQAWKRKITKACKEAGTYEPYFEEAIKTLADTLEKRDAADEQYKMTGSHPIVMYTNKGGATNPTKNPALILWDDLNKSALAYLRDLGLTPSGLKKILGDAPATGRESEFVKALKELEE